RVEAGATPVPAQTVAACLGRRGRGLRFRVLRFDLHLDPPSWTSRSIARCDRPTAPACVLRAALAPGRIASGPAGVVHGAGCCGAARTRVARICADGAALHLASMPLDEVRHLRVLIANEKR